MTNTAPVVPASQNPNIQRFVKRGAYLCCSLCGMAVEYCACARQIVQSDVDRDVADLDRRAKECKGK